ncbi:MAG: L-fucokinase [Sedimentisphaerales bacterium]|nr:L-fucokinase [Sedimentisphaerales bacterium]
MIANSWDYLIVTASNDAQAGNYEHQLALRQELGLLPCVRDVIVIPDPGGKRIGSGGSTICCLLEVLNREMQQDSNRKGTGACQSVLEKLRILIVHAGGDSKRLPVYSACGKIFFPVPGDSDCCLPLTLFDRQLPTYLKLPAPEPGAGQVVITSGDVLLGFNPDQVRFATKGLTGLGCYASVEEGKNHGIFCRGEGNKVRLFLQKPSPSEQQGSGAIDPYGQVILDIGVMNFAADTAAMLLNIFGMQLNSEGRLELTGKMSETLFKYGLDFYREICCGMGSEATLSQYIKSVKQSGSLWKSASLEQLFESICSIPFDVDVLPRCEFLHFGTSRQVVSSGNILMQRDIGSTSLNTCLSINNEIIDGGEIAGTNAWVEGCKISSRLTLGGENVIVGLDVDESVSVPSQMCFDVIPGLDRHGKKVWFVRCYNIYDSFKDSVAKGATLCGIPVLDWLEFAGAESEDIWDIDIPIEHRSLWNARIFPAVIKHSLYRQWLWLFNPAEADSENFHTWRVADRYSSAEIATLTDQKAFYQRRNLIRAGEIQKSLRKMFREDSGFSASELIHILKNTTEQSVWIADMLAEARWRYNSNNDNSLDSMVFPRVIHTIGSVLSELGDEDMPVEKVFPGLREKLNGPEHDWLDSLGLGLDSSAKLKEWAQKARSLAFESLGKVIISSGCDNTLKPRNALRSDEIVWGRAPARFDTGGGWTDTPPYSLEHGGCVIDTAVNLNCQPPIQAYLRVIDKPVIRISSIDLGTRIEITLLDELLDYRKATGEYALAKAALALSGFSHETADWSKGATLRQILEEFGGGIELTTLAAIPKGSGLGTSSIMGAVILAVIQRALGQTLTHKELFHSVLRLEQSLTTGGGWQDQIGGAVGGAKIVTAEPGLIPDARIHFLPADVLDPKINNGQTLLYYTGITRLAKDILGQVVGRYLDRDRKTLFTLKQIHSLARQVAEAISRKDIRAFGKLISAAWELNKQLDPNSTNDEVERLFSRIKPYIFGAKLLGAGGGGFLLMVCKSAEDAGKVRIMLETEPANERARFFNYDVNQEGLVVTVC